MSRIVVWSPNYAPEPTGLPPLVTDACEWLAGRGHRVDVVTAMPNYPTRRIDRAYRGALWREETRAGVRVHRSWLRVRPRERFVDKALHELTFAAGSLPNAARLLPRADVLVCVVPTLLSAAAGAALARLSPRTRCVLWVQDLVLAGALALELGPRAHSALSVAGRIEAWTGRRADRVIVCSPGFRGYLVDRGVNDDRIETIGNWVDTDWITPEPATNTRRPRFLYAGNLGYSQGFETLVQAARLVDEADVDIVGGGNAAAHVRQLAATTNNVSVRPPVARHEFPSLLASADVHVVLQRTVSAGANLPSKIAPYLASGRPIIASLDLSTPAAEVLRASGGAILVRPEAPAEFADAMRRLIADAALRARLGRAGRAYAEERLGHDAALGRLTAAILG